MTELDNILAGMNEALITPAAALTMDAEKMAAEHNKAKQAIKDLMLELVNGISDPDSTYKRRISAELRQKVEEL